jgi:hypothetical protein
MPSPLGEGQTDTPINHHNRGEVPPPFTHSPVLWVHYTTLALPSILVP